MFFSRHFRLTIFYVIPIIAVLAFGGILGYKSKSNAQILNCVSAIVGNALTLTVTDNRWDSGTGFHYVSGTFDTSRLLSVVYDAAPLNSSNTCSGDTPSANVTSLTFTYSNPTQYTLTGTVPGGGGSTNYENPGAGVQFGSGSLGFTGAGQGQAAGPAVVVFVPQSRDIPVLLPSLESVEEKDGVVITAYVRNTDNPPYNVLIVDDKIVETKREGNYLITYLAEKLLPGTHYVSVGYGEPGKYERTSPLTVEVGVLDKISPALSLGLVPFSAVQLVGRQNIFYGVLDKDGIDDAKIRVGGDIDGDEMGDSGDNGGNNEMFDGGEENSEMPDTGEVVENKLLIESFESQKSEQVNVGSARSVADTKPIFGVGKHSPLSVFFSLADYGTLNVLVSQTVLYSYGVGPGGQTISVPVEDGTYLLALLDKDLAPVFEAKVTLANGNLLSWESEKVPIDHPIFAATGNAVRLSAVDRSGNFSSKFLSLAPEEPAPEIEIEIEEILPTGAGPSFMLSPLPRPTFVLSRARMGPTFILSPDFDFEVSETAEDAPFEIEFLEPEETVREEKIENLLSFEIKDPEVPTREAREPETSLEVELIEPIVEAEPIGRAELEDIVVDISEIVEEVSPVTREILPPVLPLETIDVQIEELPTEEAPVSLELPIDNVNVSIEEVSIKTEPAVDAVVAIIPVEPVPVQAPAPVLASVKESSQFMAEFYKKIQSVFEFLFGFFSSKTNWPAGHDTTLSRGWTAGGHNVSRSALWPAGHHIGASNLGNFGSNR